MIEVKIPFAPKEQLGYAVSKCMETVEDWVLILDHDVFLSLNPHWYDICEKAIKKVGHKAGWITCYTNNIGCPIQKLKAKAGYEDDMGYHYSQAEDVYTVWNARDDSKDYITDITEAAKRWKLSGFFILTHKAAYNTVKEKFGLPDNKFIGWDNYYSDRLLDCGYKMYRMDDLYVYHGYKRLWKNKEWGMGIVGA